MFGAQVPYRGTKDDTAVAVRDLSEQCISSIDSMRYTNEEAEGEYLACRSFHTRP